jgi:hypothetical protein
MNENRKIDFSKLLGFQVLGEELSERVDFRDEAFGGRLGAKVGGKDLTLVYVPREKPQPERG